MGRKSGNRRYGSKKLQLENLRLKVLLKKMIDLKNDIRLKNLEIRERSKELECLFRISEITGESGDMNTIFQKIVNIIPLSWQYPENACARIRIENIEFKSDNYRPPRHSQKSPINIGKRTAGFVEVGYMDSLPDQDEGPFLSSEMKLIRAIAQKMGRIHEQKRAEIEIEKAHQKLRDLFEHVQNIREDERKTIAHEIHDELGHSLAIIKLNALQVKKLFSESPEKIAEQIDGICRLIDSSAHSLRRIASELRPVMIDDFGLIAAFSWQMEEVEKMTGIRCVLSSDVEDLNLDRSYATGIFRVLQELVTNVIRHAGASEIRVEFERRRNRMRIRVIDNGIGINKPALVQGNRFGILGIKERVHYWNGTFKINANPGGGTMVTMNLPLNVESPANDRNNNCR